MDKIINAFRCTEPIHERPQLDREHGRLWITCLDCGAQWAVHADDFEQVSDGDGFCQDRHDDRRDDWTEEE